MPRAHMTNTVCIYGLCLAPAAQQGASYETLTVVLAIALELQICTDRERSSTHVCCACDNKHIEFAVDVAISLFPFHVEQSLQPLVF